MKIPWLNAVLLPGRAVRGVGAMLVVIGLALGPVATVRDSINASPERLRPEMMVVPTNGSDGGFSIARTEVTQEMYQLVMGTNPSSQQVGDNLPVTDVDWYGAARYCNRLSTLEGLAPVYDETSWERVAGADGYRLPTEEEWQYAAAAGTSDTWAGTSDEAELPLYANIYGLADGAVGLAPVGSYRPNRWGLYDMSGNVWEWTESSEGSGRVFRGGSWFYPAGDARVAYRLGYVPSYRVFILGFRPARSESPSSI